MRTLDYLPNTDIYLYQDKDMFRINSDTRYLGEFLHINKNDVVLDIGTNNGALLLYANRLGCKQLIGVDINTRALELCKENLELNKISNFVLYNCKVQDLKLEKVDVVVCNPPYFKNGIVNRNNDLANARHEGELTLSELIEHSNRLLKNNGKLMIVYKSCDVVDIVKEMDKNKFGVTRVQFIYDINKDNSTCVLVEAIKNRKHNVRIIKPIIITH